METSSKKTAWNPKGIAWLSIFFSFLPAGILYALNFERFGKPELKRFYLIGIPLAFVLFMTAADVLQNTSDHLFKFVNIIIACAFYFSQQNLFEEYLKKGGQRASFKKPVLICLGVTTLFIASILAYYYFSAAKPLRLTNNKFENAYISAIIPKGWQAYENEPGDNDTLLYIVKDNEIANISISHEQHYLNIPNNITVTKEIPEDILYDRLMSIEEEVTENPDLGWNNFKAVDYFRTSTFRGFNAAEGDFLVDEKIGWEEKDTTRRIRRMVIFTKNDIYNVVFAATDAKAFPEEEKEFKEFLETLIIK